MLEAEMKPGVFGSLQIIGGADFHQGITHSGGPGCPHSQMVASLPMVYRRNMNPAVAVLGFAACIGSLAGFAISFSSDSPSGWVAAFAIMFLGVVLLTAARRGSRKAMEAVEAHILAHNERHREFTFWLTKVVLWSENRRAGRVIGYRLRVDLSTAAVVEALAQLVRAGQGREAEPLIVPPPYPGSDVPPPPQQYQPQPPGYTPGMYQPPQPEQYPPAPPAEPPLNHQALQPAPEPSAPPSEAFSGTAPICPRCHHEVVVKGARFCQACGSALP